MFGYVTASYNELTKQQQARYGAVYCGICRGIRLHTTNLARLALSYDMAFLALLLMSLYEPQEESGPNACQLHPVTKRPWVDNEYVRYAADMNVILAYYNCLDDWEDEKKASAKRMADILEKYLPPIEERFPRQCSAIRLGLERLSELEKAKCQNPDEPAGAFGQLMGELFAYRDDLWAEELRSMGFHLGRFIYLRDGAEDFKKDKKKGRYNPWLAMGGEADPKEWEKYLVLAMARCTECFERLPLVQDKALLDNILYSGVWVSRRRKRKEGKSDGGSL